MWTRRRIAAYKIIRAENIGNRTLEKIRERCPDPEAFLARPAFWEDLGLTDLQRTALAASVAADVEDDLSLMEAQGVRFLLPEDQNFPARLKEIPAAPTALFVRGAPLTDRLAVAVVGTRKQTAYGERSAAFFAAELAGIGATVVSGLALGLDGAAHRACADVGGSTIAVLPGGVDEQSLVPRSHLSLAKRLLAEGGTLCSERAPGADTRPFDYLHRNRIIAGLSDAVLVIEGDHDSGALVTARHALEQGKEVLAVPGPIWSNASRGTNALIRNGAVLCANMDDLLAALNLGNPDRAKEAARTRETLQATPEETELLALLESPAQLDDLVRRSGKPAGTISGLISILEMKGRIVAVGPRTYAKL